MGWQCGQTPNNTEEGLRERMTSQAMSLVKTILFDEDNASVVGIDLLLDVQMEITLSSESCLFCKTQFMGKPRKHKSTGEALNIATCSQDCCEFPQDPEGV
ncbi:hypothetical protein TURU_156834 [Turdus rufiventris]|nr:hypothetical protein TURU_156834 [Turdus rufiventris]